MEAVFLSGDSKATTISTDVKDYEVYISGKNAESVTMEDLKELTFTYTDQEGNEKEIPLKEIVDFTEAFWHCSSPEWRSASWHFSDSLCWPV